MNEQLIILQDALRHYQQAKREHEVFIAERRRKVFRWSVRFAICTFFICIAVYQCHRFSRNNAFLEICRTGTAGTVEEVEAAIAKGILHGISGNTPYVSAASRNPNPEVLRVLEQAGAKVDKDNALREAVNNKNIEIVKFLVQNGATNASYALEKFTKDGNIEMVKFLVQNDATSLGHVLHKFAKDGNVKMVKFLLHYSSNPKRYDFANSIEYYPQLEKALTQEIITVARKYGFKIVEQNNEYKRGSKGFCQKIIASETSIDGCVYFCTGSFCWEEGYLFFSSDNFYCKPYSDWSLDENYIRSHISNELKNSLLDRTVKALMELCY